MWLIFFSVVEYIEESYVLVVIVFLILVLLTVSVILLIRGLYRKSLGNGKPYPDSVHLMENGNVHSSNFTVENLKLEGLLGKYLHWNIVIRIRIFFLLKFYF